MAPPASLTYQSATYALGYAIADNVPVSSGGAISVYTVSPELPAGLNLDPSTGVISGTPAAVSAQHLYAVTGSNDAGSAQATFSIEVTEQPTAPTDLRYADPVASYTVNTEISPNTPTSAGGGVTYYSVIPALPAGLALDPVNGVISGVPTVVASPLSYTVTASNSAGATQTQLEIDVGPQLKPPVNLSYTNRAVVYVRGQPIKANEATVAGGPVSSFSISPVLPAGLVLDPVSGAISGTPVDTASTGIFTVTASNRAGVAQTILIIGVGERLSPPTKLVYANQPVVYARNQAITPNLPDTAGGIATNYSISPYLPLGLVLNPTSGVISGTPTVMSKRQTYAVTAGNAAGSVQISLVMEVAEQLQPPSNLAYATTTAAYTSNQVIAANIPFYTGGVATDYSVSPALPTGLALDPTSGVITGTPMVTVPMGSYVVTASNGAGSTSVSLSIGVAEEAQPPSDLSYGDVTTTYAQFGPITPNIPKNNGGMITLYEVSPELPEGLMLDPATGIISGRPAVEVSQSTYTVTGSNSAGSANATIEFSVKAPWAPKFTVGAATRVPINGIKKYAYGINDSTFPFLPNRDGTQYLAFWGDASVMRYSGTDLDSMQPPPGNESVNVTVTPGVSRDWDSAGNWMLTATRTPDGALVAFVHGEDHHFLDGGSGQWNSSGLWISWDDGFNWTNYGEVVGEPKPPKAQPFGGIGIGGIWDPVNQRWLGYNGDKAFISTDPHALPGTWYGYYNEAFSQHVDPTQPLLPLDIAPGMKDAYANNGTGGGITYNYYLRQFIRTWMWFGKKKQILAAFSPDGLHWKAPVTLFTETDPYTASYAFIVGDSSTRSGQDCYLVYMREPPAGSLRKDMIRRPIHFE
ncbi:Ig domain-containing protein [Peristeroidobacter soli]|uniref:Ig domain-containing protein n=1 Tax=Peristeroidobacter soli TaxID=2497877 RepID=UPI00158C6AF5|nr:Ig domain-containing protein [Peristeroidobacter soli]